ncbi:hypothetical protein DL89DRAFT_295344 [Linderina pennispora]|uniref:Uncharacterized protein n=1 Tax=Linderina pennispora TaxID=61395 RepID=A0A1Y1VYX6_9FUNG|nr:uncharacterized protein DL89DRAFT_295344 [Linderina pennispora]ORX66460.1 hypothetical protein DL89DRAFT_295344 [Linderina pennispora]
MLPFNASTANLTTSPMYLSTSPALSPVQQQQQQQQHQQQHQHQQQGQEQEQQFPYETYQQQQQHGQQLRQQPYSEPAQLATPPAVMATPATGPPATPSVLTVYRPVFKEVTESSQYGEPSAKRAKLGAGSSQCFRTQQVVIEPISVPILPTMPIEDMDGLVRMSEYNRELVSVLMLSQDKLASMEREQLQKRILALQAPIMASSVSANPAPLGFPAAPALTPVSKPVLVMASTPAVKMSPTSTPTPKPAESPQHKIASKPETKPSKTEQKHYVWRVYVKGLVEYKPEQSREFLSHYDIDDLDVYHFYFCTSDVCELITTNHDAPRLVRRLRKRGKIILDGFDPLMFRDSDGEWRKVNQWMRSRYAKRLLSSYSKSSHRDFRRYIHAYARDIGLELPGDEGASQAATKASEEPIFNMTDEPVARATWGPFIESTEERPGRAPRASASCTSDFKRRIRRVYTRGLFRPDQRYKFFVDKDYVRQFVDRLHEKKIGTIRSFMPLRPTHLSLSVDEQSLRQKHNTQDNAPAHVSVQLGQPSKLEPTLFPGQDMGESAAKLSDWNNELVTLALHLQEQLNDLLAAQQRQPSLLIAQPFTYPLPPESHKQEMPVLPPAKLDLSRPCRSDYKHGVRRVYTKGLEKAQNMTMKKKLASLGVDAEKVIFSHTLPFQTREFIVVSDYVKDFCAKIQQSGFEILDKFDPLDPQHPLLTSKQQKQYPSRYRASLAPVLKACVGKVYSRFKSYARDYAKDIGYKV